MEASSLTLGVLVPGFVAAGAAVPAQRCSALTGGEAGKLIGKQGEEPKQVGNVITNYNWAQFMSGFAVCNVVFCTKAQV